MRQYLSMIGIKSSVLILTVMIFQKKSAQNNDVGVWLDAFLSKKYGSSEFMLYSEFFTNEGNQSIDRLSIGVEMEREMFSFFNIGGGYLLMDKNKAGNYELRHRFYTQAKIKKKTERINFNFRERIQITRYPQNESRKPDYLTYWRNRLKMSYQIASCRVTPLVGVETFVLLNNTESKRLDEIRYNVPPFVPCLAHLKSNSMPSYQQHLTFINIYWVFLTR